jgi:hypothetical protein
MYVARIPSKIGPAEANLAVWFQKNSTLLNTENHGFWLFQRGGMAGTLTEHLLESLEKRNAC